MGMGRGSVLHELCMYMYTCSCGCFYAQVAQVNGNLKVKLPPLESSEKGEVELVEPIVLGFIGECRLIESTSSILEVSVTHSTFIVMKTLDLKIISVEAT